MAHGSLASGDTWGKHARRFMANGYCPSQLSAFDYNSTLGVDAALPLLDAHIDRLLEASGATQVDLFGHSLGGGLGYAYLADAARAAKVRRYVHIGSSTQPGVADPETPMLNLVSSGDLVVQPAGEIDGAENVILTEEDHYAVATSAASFEAIYTFLNDMPPAATEPAETALPIVAGKAVTLAENAPLAGGTVSIWPVDPDTGVRISDEPLAALTVADDGSFGPVRLNAEQRYEWVVQGAGSVDKPVHYFRENLTGNNPLVYLRTLPPANSLAGSLLAGVTFNDTSSSLVLFMESRALVAGEDSLTLDDLELATEQNAAAASTTIALFLYDENENGVTDGSAVSLFASFPFLAGVDVFVSADPPASAVFRLNDRALAVRSWPGSQGAVIAVFE